MGPVDVEPLKYHCSCGRGGCWRRGARECMLQRLRDSGSNISIIGYGGLRTLQGLFPEFPIVYPYERGPSVTVAEGRGQTTDRRADGAYDDAVGAGGDTCGCSCVSRGWLRSDPGLQNTPGAAQQQ